MSKASTVSAVFLESVGMGVLAVATLAYSQPYLCEDDSVQVLNFPTKRHWRDNSLIQDIEDGLKHLAESYEQMAVDTESSDSNVLSDKDKISALPPEL